MKNVLCGLFGAIIATVGLRIYDARVEAADRAEVRLRRIESGLDELKQRHESYVRGSNEVSRWYDTQFDKLAARVEKLEPAGPPRPEGGGK